MQLRADLKGPFPAFFSVTFFRELHFEPTGADMVAQFHGSQLRRLLTKSNKKLHTCSTKHA